MRSRLRCATLVFVVALAACTGSETATTSSSSTTAQASSTVTTTTVATPPDSGVVIGTGIVDDTIKLGVLADTTGDAAAVVADLVDAQRAFWDEVNSAGGIGGRFDVELEVVDTGGDPSPLDEYRMLSDDVLMLSMSFGSAPTHAITENLARDNLVAIPAFTWYSGWADPNGGKLILEQGTNYCLEAMNLVEYAATQALESAASLSIVTFPGEYGEDAAAGATAAAGALGLDVRYDGIGAVTSGQDLSDVVGEIVDAAADVTFAAVDPSTLAGLLAGATDAGYEGVWTGPGLSYTFGLLDSPVAETLTNSWIGGAYFMPWGSDAPGMDAVVSAISARYPDRAPSDALVLGWVEGVIAKAVLDAAFTNGDLTRAGVVAASLSLPVSDLQGLAPPQGYAGVPDDYVVRSSIVFRPDLQAFIAGGGSAGTVAGGGTTGARVVEEFSGSIAADFAFDGACSSR